MQLATTVILARILRPSDFGLAGMAMVAIGFITLFKDLGTSSAIIREKQLSPRLSSSIFWINVAFGFIAMVALMAAAPVVAGLYHEPQVTPLLRALSITFLISGLSIAQQAILERGLAFHLLAKVDVAATACSSVVGIGMAFAGFGVWSLVYQILALASITTALLWTVSRWRPLPIFDWQEVKSVCGYSLNLTGFSILNYFARNADYVLVGRYLGAQQLGYYLLAYRIMLYPLQSVSAVVNRVMFPILSQMQDDDTRFRRIYLNVIGSIALVTFPMMLGLMALNRPFILGLLGRQWSPVIILLAILAPVGLVQSIVTTVGIIYQAKGRTDWFFRWGLAAGAVVFIAFVMGLKWGVVGVASAYAIASGILLYPSLYIPFRLIKLRVGDLALALWRPLLCSILMAAAIVLVSFILPAGLSPRLVIGLLIPLCVAAYLATSWIINRPMLLEMLGYIRRSKED